MAEYRYYLIPDFMSHVFPQQFEDQAPTEFFSNTADLMKRYKQLREMPYNNEYTWNERTNLPYPRLTVGIDRRDPDGAVTVMQVRNGVNYLCDDYRGPFADRNDKQLIEMAKQLVTAVGVDRIRPHYYTEENGHAKVHVGKDIHITEWANAPELCSALRFSRFLNRDGQQLFQVRNGQRIIENYADGSQLVKDVQTVDDTHFYVGSRFCHIQQYANQCFKRGCYVQDGTRTAEEVLHIGGDVLRMELGSSAVQIGSAGTRTALHYAETFSTSADDFADRAPGIISNTGFQAGHSVIKVARFFAHPVKALASIGRTALICGAIVLLLLIIGLLGQMSGTTTTSVLCADRPEDIQQLVESINTYRNEAATDELCRAFRNDVDPNGNPYGYDTLTGQRSNNMQHGVTWSYANGIYNDTAEIISMAAVYYQQDWPSSQELAAFTDDVPFTQYCRALTAYGMEITARESAPYSCISYGGCVNGYRSEGETVTITEYRCETHTCAQGNEECGHYRNGIWEWSDDHEEGGSCPEWIEDGTHDVTVFFPVIFPDGATQSELCTLPDDYAQVVDGKIAAEDCTGSIVLDESANLYKGELNDWFYAPNERTATFTVETTDGDETMTKDYTVTFANATAIPWCPGELHDGQYGHYDLNCTIYLTGYDRYADPETEAPNGADGGTGNLEALAESSNDGTLTRTVIKQDQYGNAYAGNAVTARFTKTVTLPPGAAGFKGWYENGADTYGNVEWASLLYRMDWEALYGVADGIKCRSVGSALTVDELQALLAGLNIDPDTARGQVVAFAISCQGHFVYGQPSSLRGGPGNASVGMNLDCSSFVQYCYWAQGLPFSAGNTAAYGRTGDLRAISPAEVQPGDLRVVYATGGEQGHVQMALGGGAWIECCYGYGVCVNMSNAWMESRGCHYFTYAGF